MNRAARRAALAERQAEAEREAFERSVPVEPPAPRVAMPRPRPAPRRVDPGPSSLLDEEPLEGVVPVRRRLDLGFGLVLDARELRLALDALADRVAARGETAPPRWTGDEWRGSCRGAWSATPRHDDESPDHRQNRCARCAICAWERWLDDYNARFPEADRLVRDRPPPPRIEELVRSVCTPVSGAGYLPPSPLGALVDRAEIYGPPRVDDPRDRKQLVAAARRIAAWRSGKRPWTEHIEVHPTRIASVRTPEFARDIEGKSEWWLSWRWALSDPEARGGLTEKQAQGVVYARLCLINVEGKTYSRDYRGSEHVWRSAEGDVLDVRPYPLDQIATAVARTPEQVRAIVGAIVTRFRVDLAARRLLPPVHPRSSAFALYQERCEVRGRTRT